MVAGRVRDDTRTAFGKLKHPVEGATELERSDSLQVLGLEEQLGACANLPSQNWRSGYMWGDATGGGPNIVEIDHTRVPTSVDAAQDVKRLRAKARARHRIAIGESRTNPPDETRRRIHNPAYSALPALS